MLKVERSKSDKISVRLRSPKSRFDRYFCTALGIALAIHLTAALVFHVRLFTFGQIETILPATTVSAPLIKSSADEKDALVTSIINMEGRLTAAHLAPPLSQPTMTSYDHLIAERPLSTAPSALVRVFSPADIDADESSVANQNLPITTTPLRLHISGPLSDYTWENPKEFADLFIEMQMLAKQLQKSSLLYEVRIDGRNGQIFWFNLESPHIKDPQKTIAEKLLLAIRFDTHKTDFIYGGQIEFIFSTEGA